jgi:tetratricopeptide (TPR) repeat protein
VIVWRRTVGTIALSIAALGADVPPTVRIPAPPLTPAEHAKRDALATFGSARLRQRADDAVGAVKQLEAAAKLDPSSLAPRRELVSIYADLGRDAAAIRTARAVLAADPQDADTAHNLAKLLFAVQRNSEAGDVLTAAIESSRLADRPMKALAMRIDVARCREAGSHPKADVAWQSVRTILTTDRERLLKDGLTAAELDSETATAAEKHGQALILRKQFDAANEAFLAARDLFADPKRANDPASAARLHRNLADLAAARGDSSAAVKHLEAYLAFRPRDVAPYEAYAEHLRKSGRDAIAKLEALPAPAAKWVALAERARSPAGFAEAHGRFSDLAKESTDPAFFRVLARTYATADSGSGLLQIAESIFPDSPERPRKARSVSSKEAERRQAYASALVAQPGLALKLAQAARLSSGTSRSPEFWELLVWAATRAGRPDVVKEAMESSFSSDGGFRSFQRLAHHLTVRREWEAVLKLCDSSPNLGQGILNYYRSVPLAELNRSDEALRAVAKAEGDNAFASRRQKVQILDILGRHADMLKECDAAMEEFRTPVETRSLRFLRAQAFLGLKMLRESEDELRGILDDDADDALALNNLGYNLADQNRKLDEAERLIRRAIEIDSDDRARAGEPNTDHAAYLDSLGWVLFRKGKLAEAREQLEKAAALPDGATDPTVWDHLGDVAFRTGDPKRAKEAWAKAAEQYKTTHVGREGGRREEAVRKMKLVE